MAVALFDLEVVVNAPIITDGLSPSDKAKLLQKVRVASTKPKQAGEILRTSSTISQALEAFTLEELEEGYTELIDRSKNILRTINQRGKALIYNFNPQLRPDLSEAVSSLFAGVNSKITMEMYLTALQLEKDISVEVGESQLGAIR